MVNILFLLAKQACSSFPACLLEKLSSFSSYSFEWSTFWAPSYTNYVKHQYLSIFRGSLKFFNSGWIPVTVSKFFANRGLQKLTLLSIISKGAFLKNLCREKSVNFFPQSDYTFLGYFCLWINLYLIVNLGPGNYSIPPTRRIMISTFLYTLEMTRKTPEFSFLILFRSGSCPSYISGCGRIT